MSQRVRAKELHEITFDTPEGPLTIAVVLLLDGRIGIYEWDEDYGYSPLESLTPEIRRAHWWRRRIDLSSRLQVWTTLKASTNSFFAAPMKSYWSIAKNPYAYAAMNPKVVPNVEKHGSKPDLITTPGENVTFRA